MIRFAFVGPSSLWRVVKSDFSQLSSLAVPLLLHALSLPHGADIFWTIINSNFNSKDWKMRFEAGRSEKCMIFACGLIWQGRRGFVSCRYCS